MITKEGAWWEYSWNVAPGCSKVSEECSNCWALAMGKRLQGMKKPGYEGLVDERGVWIGKVNLLKDRLRDPLNLKRPRTIAVNLMGDLFHAEVPVSFILAVFETMMHVDWHNYLVLTKRPERMAEVLKGWWTKEGRPTGSPLQNVWLGTTAGTQRSANERWAPMMVINQMGWKTWVSSEPRLEKIDWHGWEFLKRMITGGESGPYARPMSPAWPRSDRDWCQDHNVAFWFTQWGEWGPEVPGVDLWNYGMTTMGNEILFRFGRTLAGRVLDGRTWEEESNSHESNSRIV
jgi:protein gp37